jgi:twitching motility protein PilT
VATHATRNLIREGKTNQLRNTMTTNQKERMLTMEMTLNDLIRSGTITYETALSISAHPKEIIGRPA